VTRCSRVNAARCDFGLGISDFGLAIWEKKAALEKWMHKRYHPQQRNLFKSFKGGSWVPFFAMSVKTIKSKFSCLMRDLKGVINPAYLMGYIGHGMYRRSVRRTGLIGLAALAVSVLGRGLGLLPEFTVGKAAIVALIYGFATLFGGLGLKTISNMLMSERINIAEANNLNLLEDKKKSRLDFYLRRLYDSVFRFEAAVRYSDEEIQREDREIRKNVEEITKKLMSSLSEENLSFLGVTGLPTLVEHMSKCNPLKARQLECSWEGFRITANYALTHPLPATLEAEIIGFDLTLVEDWLDGACFDANDVKLVEQYKANSTIVLIKKQVGYGLLDKIWQSWKGFCHSFWFHNTFRSVAVGVGTQIRKLNRKVGRGYFKTEHLLWIHPDLDRSVEEKFGSEVLEELISRRKHLIQKIFSRKYGGAVELLRRIYRPKVELAIDLRKRFDCEYFLGELGGQSYLYDLERLSCSSPRIERERARVEQARENDALLMRYLKEQPGLLPEMNSLQRRAVKTALHLNLFHLRELLSEYFASPTDVGDKKERFQSGETIQRILSRTVADEARFSRTLVTLRTFWLLNWLEFDEYCRQVKEIAYADEDSFAAAE